jgi:5'-nucleotidase
MKRREFIINTGLATGGLLFGSPLLASAPEHDLVKLTILHTNDVHSRVEPFPNDGSRNAGRGGAARRSSLISNIRAKEPNVLLFDSGDMIQGTPYFNFFNGEVEIQLMNKMKYDATTIGNHDFDGGLDGLVKMTEMANFPFLISNYDWRDNLMQGKTLDYKIFEVEGAKIGVFGLGIEMDGLVPAHLTLGTEYQDPLDSANKTASKLKNELKCDYVVCLSHLGYKYRGDRVSDLVLASSTSNIDLILGGHTHTFMRKPDLLKNQDGKNVIVNQVGFAGLILGRLDIVFEKNKKNKCVSCRNITI